MDEWRRARVVAQMWWCGDYDCDCTQPQVERISPNLQAGYPWIRRELLWAGTFLSSTSEAEPEQREQQRRELLEAAARFGAELLEQ